MKLNTINNKQLMPCIIAKAKMALELPTSSNGNKKNCSDKYWLKAVNHIAKFYGIEDEKRIQKALKRTDLYRK